jgi:hypothetical protein
MTARIDGLPRKRQVPRLIVKVTADDIATAIPANSSHCMVGRAIARQLGVNERFVSVDLQVIEASDPKRHLRMTWLTPEAAQRSLLDFDEGRPVEPLTFTLQNPIQVRPSNLGLPRAARRPAQPSEVIRAARREERKAELIAKEEAGTLTREDKAALTTMRKTDAMGGPLISAPARDPKVVIPPSTGSGRTTRVEGGKSILPPNRNRTLSNRIGQRRVYGLRAAARR